MAVPKEILEKLSKQEAVEQPGAAMLTPKQYLLDASSVQATMPDRRLRWVNLRDPHKVASRKAEGYEIVSNEEGGRRLGDEFVLMAQPRERYDVKIAALEGQNKARLSQHKDELARVVEGVVKQLRDRHGITVDLNRILVNEG